MTEDKKVVAYLIVENQPNIKQPIPIFEGQNTFGRNPLKAQVCLPDNSISEKHARIKVSGDKIILIDVGSKNGTSLNNSQNKLQKNANCQVLQKQSIFFAQIKCHFILNKEKGQLLQIDQTVCNQFSNKNTRQQKKSQKNKKSKTLQSKNIKQQSSVSPNKKQNHIQFQTCLQTTVLLKDTKQLKGKKNKSMDLKKTVLQNQQTVDLKEQKNKKERKLKNTSKQKIKQKETKNVDKKDKPKRSKQKNESKDKDKVKQKQVKFSKVVKDLSEEQDGTKVKQKASQIKQSRKRVSSQQAIQLRVSITRKRFTICTRFMVSGFLLTFSPHQQLKFIQNFQDDFDVLVMQKYSRTFKLLYAVSKGLPIVTKDWLFQSQYYLKAMPVEHYLLTIPEDKLLLKKSIEKVRQGFRLLSNLKFYLICDHQKYHLNVNQIQKLIYSMDGQLIQAINPGKGTKTKNVIKNAYLILSRQFSKQDLQKAKQLNKDKIFTIELLLQGCLKQELDLQAHKVE